MRKTICLRFDEIHDKCITHYLLDMKKLTIKEQRICSNSKKKKVFSVNMKPHLSTAMMKDKPLSWKMSKFMFKNIIARNTEENIM